MKRYIEYLVDSKCCVCGNTFTGLGFRVYWYQWEYYHIDCWENEPEPRTREAVKDPDAPGA